MIQIYISLIMKKFGTFTKKNNFQLSKLGLFRLFKYFVSYYLMTIASKMYVYC